MIKTLLISSLLLSTSLCAKSTTKSYDFETQNLTHWQQVGTWKREGHKTKNVLSLTQRSKGSFNLCYTKAETFLDGSISVAFKANAGHIDQGGGIMWRVQDNDNYYVARFNPLEDNFRFYIVQEGVRREIASADVTLSKGWHTMKITQKGHTFAGYLDGNKHLESQDSRLNKAGGVGVWTKADAQTSFDTLTIMIQK